jgi:hypothetical protein
MMIMHDNIVRVFIILSIHFIITVTLYQAKFERYKG